jgi:hypothetical protein
MRGTKMRLIGKLTAKPTANADIHLAKNCALYPVLTRVSTNDMKNDITNETRTEKTTE